MTTRDDRPIDGAPALATVQALELLAKDLAPLISAEAWRELLAFVYEQGAQDERNHDADAGATPLELVTGLSEWARALRSQ